MNTNHRQCSTCGAVLPSSQGSSVARFGWGQGFYRLYPNLFTVLVAGSARCRKTTAIEIAIGLTKNVDGVRQLNGKVSAEKFLHIHTIPDNQPQRPTLIKADELATFLTRDGQGEKSD